jgi:hypothetical protein
MSDEVATCRNCGKVLIGKPYYMGGDAYIPGPKRERAPVNFYGGYVCSYECDRRASLALERTMPGHDHRQQSIGCFALERLKRNWPEVTP